MSQTLSSDENRTRGGHGSLLVTPCTTEPLRQSVLVGDRVEPRDILGKDSFSVVGWGGAKDPTLLSVREQRRSSQKRGVMRPRAGASLEDGTSNHKDKKPREVRTSEHRERLKVNLECLCKP